MQEINTITKTQIDVSSLYPGLSLERQQEASFYLTQYIDLVKRIHHRVRNLTASSGADTMWYR
ncbi:MAG: hypothetical protein FD167_3686 [bacterium]|nr:MAG: hypothetical protein FD167_3686 [bacterium]